MNVTSLPAIPGSRHRKKRVGRGVGSGHGKTSTRGQKGQRARTGSRKHPGFEGGQNPLIRRLPKRGFKRKDTGRKLISEVVNLSHLQRFRDGSRVTVEQLEAAGLIRDAGHRIKLLGDGECAKKLTVAVHAASESAKAKLAKVGGSVGLISASKTTTD